MNFRSVVFLLPLFLGYNVFGANTISAYKTNMIVDGKNTEWTSPLPHYDKMTGINYDVANDSRNIYFILRIADEVVQQKIFQNGLEVWLNKDGKKKMTSGITYPMAVTKPTTGVTPQKSTTAKIESPLNATELTLTGFFLENGKQPVKGCPVHVALSKDSFNCLIYELAVPFNTFYKEKLTPEDISTKLFIGFVVKAPSLESIAASGMGGMGMPGMGGGMGGGMDSPDMERMRSMGLNTQMEMDNSIWFKIQFSLQP
jgi:hypothetical protein